MTVFLIVLACVIWTACGALGCTLNWLRDFGEVTIGDFVGFIILGMLVGVIGLIALGIPWGTSRVIFRKKT